MVQKENEAGEDVLGRRVGSVFRLFRQLVGTRYQENSLAQGRTSGLEPSRLPRFMPSPWN